MLNIESYKRLEEQLRKYQDYPIILSVRRYKLFSIIINFAAWLKGRDSWSHTAYIYFRDGEAWHYDISLTKGVSTKPLYYEYFYKKYKGRVVAHILPNKKKKKEIFNWNKSYSTKMAILAWSKFIKQNDKKNKGYCTDEVLDVVEYVTDKQLLGNNAKVTPAILYHFCEKKNFKRINIC